jgi:hypothetical protein
MNSRRPHHCESITNSRLIAGSVHRGATFEIVDSSEITVANCTFKQIGGNGVLLSNSVQNTTIHANEFVQVGDSAVVSVGSSVGIVGTAPTFPRGNVISNNHMHEIGLYGKQTSCYFQALGQHNTLENNLCYNGPRAGIVRVCHLPLSRQRVGTNDGFTPQK